MRELIVILCCTLGTTVLLIAAAGCNQPSPDSFSVTGTVAGRQITAWIYTTQGFYPPFDSATIKASEKAGPVSGPVALIHLENDGASIRLGRHDVRVEREQIVLDGKAWNKIPAATRDVQLVLSNATLTVTAKGASGLTTLSRTIEN